MQKSYYNYPVKLVENAFGESSVLADTLKSLAGAEDFKLAIVADINVVQRVPALGSQIGRYVQAHGLKLAGAPVVLASGEKVKSDNLQSVMRVFSALLELKVGLGDLVLVIGGGAVADVAGFAAAQVRGGVRVVRMPTTPAAMLGSAYAESARVNFNNIKDALQVPMVPAAVILDPQLATANVDGVWCGGFLEAVRLALLRDASFFKTLQSSVADYRSRKLETLTDLCEAVMTLRRKKAPVEMGDWLAAHLTTISDCKLPYGYAQVLSLLVELAYAVEIGAFKAADRASVIQLLDAGGVFTGTNHYRYLFQSPDAILRGLDAMTLKRGNCERELPKAIGKAQVDVLPQREVYTHVLNFDKIFAI